jgi:Lon protease-like protein
MEIINMKPGTPFIQTFEQLPDELPIYTLGNALLAGGELPLELSSQTDLALFFDAIRSNQLIGLRQPKKKTHDGFGYNIGCAGRIRQYRERSDGRLNVMLTGVCRFKIISEQVQKDGYIKATVDWSAYKNDYENETVEQSFIDNFIKELKSYFDRNRMQVDWAVLDKQPIEKLINNLVLVVDFSIEDKQSLLEAKTLTDRTLLFTDILLNNVAPLNTQVIN